MDVTNVTASPAPVAAAPAAPPVISSDFETFLKMLTVQMQNQDPLNPMQSSDFAVQLATFSGVEQQVQTNQLLQGLSSQMGLMGMSQIAGWVGMEVRAAVPAHFNGDPIELTTQIPAIADRSILVVRNEMGTVVEERSIPVTTQTMEWAGFSDGGTPFPSGHYSFEVLNYEGERLIGATAVSTYGRVTEARSEGGKVMLVMAGGGRVPVEAVTGLRAPS
ncbi:flagellar hook capping FlgD N-terminal domain-containing protein [Plastorhodobacter daqingensis]|uniref:Basal-body rod modification protein FlgD n=1 Tax=Plastorhodobacter daqingensis TaxID=1387281 RepID=A0ABW2UD95_9RHOB